MLPAGKVDQLQSGQSSGKSGTMRSIQQFAYQKQTIRAIRFDLNSLGFQHVSHFHQTDQSYSKY